MTRRFISGNSGTRHQSYQAFQATWGKRSASTYGQLFGYALRQIPGCSKAVAVTLMIKYGTINNFMESLSSMNKKEAEVKKIFVVCHCCKA